MSPARSRPRPPLQHQRSRQRRRLPAAVAVATLLVMLVGCRPAHHQVVQPPVNAAALALQQRAALGAQLAFTASYAAVANDGRTATVRVWVRPGAYRVEIVEAGVTAALFGSGTGTIACPEVAGTKPICFRVAAAGQAIPTEFDAGVQRIFTQDLPTLATSAAAFAVTESIPSTAAVSASADARCFSLTPAGTAPPLTQPFTSVVDLGTYCLSDTGLPVLLHFASGTLTLRSHGGPPTNRQLLPPAIPQPLPAPPAGSGSGTASAPPSFPVILPTASAG